MKKAVYRKAGPSVRRLHNLRMYGEIVGRRLGITIQSSHIATGATDGKVVQVNTAAFSDDPDAVTLLEGICKHEFGHVRYTDFEAKRSILNQPLALSFYRALEDGRMEMRQRRDYPGMAVSIEAALGIMIGKGLFGMPGKDESPGLLFPNMLLSWVRSQYLGQTALEPMYLARLAMLHDLFGLKLPKQFLGIARTGLERATCTADVVQCALDLQSFLHQEQQSMEQRQQDQSGDDQEDGSSQNDPDTGPDTHSPEDAPSEDQKEGGGPGSSGAHEEEGDGDQREDNRSAGGDGNDEKVDQRDEGEQANGEPSGDGGNRNPHQGEEGSNNAESPDNTGDGSSSNHEPDGSSTHQEDSGVPTSSGQEGPCEPAKALNAIAQALAEEDIPETDLGSLLQAAMDETPGSFDPTQILNGQALENSLAIAYYDDLTRQVELRVASHLEVLLESRIEERTRVERHGRKLATRHLSRVTSSPVPRVFRNEDEVNGVSTAVTVLLDVSGSMNRPLADGCSRLHAAVASARAAVSAMDRHEVPCALHFFGEYLTPAKDFDEPWRRVKNLHWGDTEDNTLTGHAIEKVVPVLACREEARKLLLLVTDGIPYDPDRTCSALQACTEFGVETALLLINSEDASEKAWLDQFKQLLYSTGISWIEVNSTDQLADGLMQSIKDAV